MPEVIDGLIAQAKINEDVEKSAKIVIDGIAARIQAAVDKAVAGGATAEQLAPLNDEIALLKASGDDLSAAIKANTE